MTQLAKHHLVTCVTLSDSNILALAQQPLKDSKSGYQKTIAEKLLREKEEVLEILVRRGAVAIDVPAYQLTMAVINKYLELKARSRIWGGVLVRSEVIYRCLRRAQSTWRLLTSCENQITIQ